MFHSRNLAGVHFPETTAAPVRRSRQKYDLGLMVVFETKLDLRRQLCLHIEECIGHQEIPELAIDPNLHISKNETCYPSLSEGRRALTQTRTRGHKEVARTNSLFNHHRHHQRLSICTHAEEEHTCKRLSKDCFSSMHAPSVDASEYFCIALKEISFIRFVDASYHTLSKIWWGCSMSLKSGPEKSTCCELKLLRQMRSVVQ